MVVGIADLSTFIRQNNEPILSEWEARAADAHGRDRADGGFTLVHMMAEFRALRTTVMRLWVAQSPRFGHDELEAMIRFNEAIDQVVERSLARYERDLDNTRQHFLAILSHDLRNPLGAIGAAAGFLAEVADLEPNDARLVRMIQNASNRMTHLIADMLELALNRLGDRMPIQRGIVDIRSLVDSVVAEIRASSDRATIEVCSEGDLVGQWDEARLAQALTNLIGNAVQHGDIDEPIRIVARGADSEVAIEVRNSGPRIPNEQLRRIFDGSKPGSRPSGDRRHLGLGLFIVNKIIEGHGGSIDVHSANDETAFTIHLPRAA